jgi:hypothetical protein
MESENGIFRNFPKSDNIFVRKIMDQLSVPIGEMLPRVEYILPNGRCHAYTGIFEFSGWSHDGLWLAYEHMAQMSILYLINFLTGQSILIEGSFTDLNWAPNTAELLAIERGLNQLEIISIDDDSKVISSTIDYPEQKVSNNRLIYPRWNSDGSAIYLLEVDRSEKPKQSTWQYDRTTQLWNNTMDLDGQVRNYLAANDLLIFCIEINKVSQIKIINEANVSELITHESDNHINCSTLNTFKQGGKYFISYATSDTDKVVVINTDQFPNLETEIFKLNGIDWRDGLQISHISWDESSPDNLR